MELRVKDLCKSYKEHIVLEHLSFTAKSGSITCIKGESGSGKSTFLHILSGFTKADSGTIITDLPKMEFTISCMPCGKVLLDALTIGENMKMVCDTASKAELERYHIGELFDRYPKDLSTGEYRRALLCRTFLKDAQIYVLDEPTANLDAKTADLIVRQIEEHKNKDSIILVASHDQRIFAAADQIVYLEKP